MKMREEAIEPPIDTAKIVMRVCFGMSTAASGLSAASPSRNLSVQLSSSLEGSAIG
jgi:hypothetical protein